MPRAAPTASKASPYRATQGGSPRPVTPASPRRRNKGVDPSHLPTPPHSPSLPGEFSSLAWWPWRPHRFALAFFKRLNDRPASTLSYPGCLGVEVASAAKDPCPLIPLI